MRNLIPAIVLLSLCVCNPLSAQLNIHPTDTLSFLEAPLVKDPQNLKIIVRDDVLILVSNEQHFIKVYSHQGNLIRAFGQRGRGPGDFIKIGTLNLYADTLFYFDFMQQRSTKMNIKTGTYIGGGIVPLMPGFTMGAVAAFQPDGVWTVASKPELPDPSETGIRPTLFYSASPSMEVRYQRRYTETSIKQESNEHGITIRNIEFLQRDIIGVQYEISDKLWISSASNNVLTAINSNGEVVESIPLNIQRSSFSEAQKKHLLGLTFSYDGTALYKPEDFKKPMIYFHEHLIFPAGHFVRLSFLPPFTWLWVDHNKQQRGTFTLKEGERLMNAHNNHLYLYTEDEKKGESNFVRARLD